MFLLLPHPGEKITGVSFLPPFLKSLCNSEETRALILEYSKSSTIGLNIAGLFGHKERIKGWASEDPCMIAPALHWPSTPPSPSTNNPSVSFGSFTF